MGFIVACNRCTRFSILKNITNLARSGATISILLNYSVFEDRLYATQLGLPILDENFIKSILFTQYRKAGMAIARYELLNDTAPYPTTWGQKLIRGSNRAVLLIEATIE
jgi:hypothetical protein